MISERLITVLQSAGWTPDRKVSTTAWVNALRQYGFAVLPSGVAILENLGGLTLTPVRSAQAVFSCGPIVFDPVRAAAAAEDDRVDYWQNHLGCKLMSIAEMGGQAALLLAEDGRVFFCWDTTLELYGDTLFDALENTIIFGERKPTSYGEIRDDYHR